ncbi:hypothetical protein ACIA74_30195 [Streptomyces sp. NPDC051658]|uniref:hypothetical protein n=1 Tax=Streptomyces sp. NPDC051658 TaxID=3365667 RepID=UPI0037AE7E52
MTSRASSASVKVLPYPASRRGHVQEGLFELRRDWRPVVELARQDLPTLTDSAERLLLKLNV